MSALFCRVELNKTDGIVITLDNKDGGITHTLVFNGEDITTTSKGDAGTSTITQAPDKIVMDCKTFELTAETISCSSTSTTDFKSSSDFSITSDTNINMSGSSQINATAGLIKLQ